MLKNQKGFSFIIIITAVIILIITAVVFFTLFIKNSLPYTTAMRPKEEKIKNKPKIYNLGVNFDKFDPSTSKAGDFMFSKEKAYESRVFLEFGYQVQNEQGKKTLPHPTYFLPKGTKVKAVSSGYVVELRSQKDSGDFELSVEPKDAPGWRITYDHLENVPFKKGDIVNTGDIVGEVPLVNRQPGDFGMTEISVFIDGTKDEDIENYCPYMLLDQSVKDMYAKKILQFVKDWEEYTGDASMYNEKSWVFPGCRFEKINEADILN